MAAEHEIATEAQHIYTALISGEDFDLPVVDLTNEAYQIPTALLGDQLYGKIDKITIDDLTTGQIDGDGVFDVIMRSFNAHIQKQFKENRITGAEYGKTYLGMVQSAMSGAVQFLLGRDGAFWQAQTAQFGAISALYDAHTSKARLALVQFEAQNIKATFALTKAKLASEEVAYEIASYNLDNILPTQYLMAQEQVETQRSQTMDTRTDGITPVAGSIGKQKELHAQQITSYRRDAETKVAKLFVDAWITQKTIDEGLLAPAGFTNASLDQVLTKLKSNNALNPT